MQRPLWTKVGLDAAVIVGSILLAFGLQAWWDGVQANREARSELAVVLEELREAREEIAAMGLWHDRLGRTMRSLAQQLDGTDTTATVMVADTLLAGALLFPVTDPPLTVFDAFLGSGQLQELQNAELRRSMARWRAQVEDQRSDELRARSFEDSEMAPYLRSQLPMAEAQRAAAALWASGLDSTPSQVGQRMSLSPSQQLDNLVARQIAWYRLTSSQSKAVLEALEDLMGLIGDELGTSPDRQTNTAGM